jgi:HSP20 family protein
MTMLTMLDPLLDPVAVPYANLRNQVGSMLEDFLSAPAQWAQISEVQRYPAVNIWEDGDAAHLEAELPGVRMENIEILVSGNQLRLAVERQTSAPENVTWHRQERAAGSFSRTFTLPWDMNADKVEAKLNNGILTVLLPKAETAKPRKIKLLTT